ncbi:MAG TPA: respiratory nitrate reductase subunit gamma [Candidatus Angelobacter sp.]
MKLNFLFAIFPYVAPGLLVVGTAVRYLLLRKHPEIISAEIKEVKASLAGNRLWQISLVFLVVGHLIALVMPRMLLQWNSSHTRLYLLEGAAFAIGCAALAGWIVVLWRSLSRHGESRLIELSDMALLALLFVGISSGLLMAVLYRWGSTWGAMILTPYLMSVLRGEAAAHFVLQMPFLARLHVFSLFASIAVLPVTRVGTVLVVGLRAIFGLAGRLASGAAGAAEGWFKKHNPAGWLWPEED